MSSHILSYDQYCHMIIEIWLSWHQVTPICNNCFESLSGSIWSVKLNRVKVSWSGCVLIIPDEVVFTVGASVAAGWVETTENNIK